MQIKEKIFNIINKLKTYEILILKITLFIISVSIIFIILSISNIKINNTYSDQNINDVVLNTEEAKENNEENKKIKVDIKGSVLNPGVYEMANGDRVNDVILLAGGFTESYSTKYINMSKKVTDEMVIYIYSNEEIEALKNNIDDESKINEEIECLCEETKNDACYIYDEEAIYESSNTSNKSNDQKVDLNTATVEELMTLDGIGESKAKAIIEYRKENKFESAEDIMKVSGIGESLYSKIKENIIIR